MQKAKLLWRMRGQRKKLQVCPMLSAMMKASCFATHMGSRAPDSHLPSLSLPCWSGGKKGSGIVCLKGLEVFGAILISGWGSLSRRRAKLHPCSLTGWWWGDWCCPHVPFYPILPEAMFILFAAAWLGHPESLEGEQQSVRERLVLWWHFCFSEVRLMPPTKKEHLDFDSCLVFSSWSCQQTETPCCDLTAWLLLHFKF